MGFGVILRDYRNIERLKNANVDFSEIFYRWKEIGAAFCFAGVLVGVSFVAFSTEFVSSLQIHCQLIGPSSSESQPPSLLKLYFTSHHAAQVQPQKILTDVTITQHKLTETVKLLTSFIFISAFQIRTKNGKSKSNIYIYEKKKRRKKNDYIEFSAKNGSSQHEIAISQTRRASHSTVQSGNIDWLGIVICRGCRII